ncbi:LacI family DNA-binding transcriptional regulator [Cellulomonas gilvus]|uniref:Transcriptional regulator, LacI family n=1 Tax=Cellulomonas gilvus (strain ATCC 13127 / NRRL B-14078) TaxID=593907 RepID=F8A2Y0_CELGA|nr:LacI family DNA-binding transcriptional regulator [Cellulomonas gilvus]AEI10697.1 transcriptional regulator, LacI family [Cellulomonas gilvus ATCC 13127]
MEPRATPRKRPTIRDVAAAAGVSRGTVSRVINGGHWVSPEALAAVEEAIRTTGYKANQHARSLVTGRSNSVAFLLTEPQHLLFEDPNFSILLRCAANELAARGMPLLLMVAGTPAEQEQMLGYVGAGHVDGVLLISSHAGSPVLRELVAQQIPTIACGIPLGFESRVGCVAADDLGGARVMTRHLMERGRSRIAMITGPMDTPGGRLRLEGYRQELGDAYDESLVVHGDYTRASGGRAMAELLERRPDLDAVFAANDLMAASAMVVLADSGRTVPDDVAVGGFDDAGVAVTVNPNLTTMRQPFERISSEMVRLLLEVVDGHPPAAVTLPASLVVREST